MNELQVAGLIVRHDKVLRLQKSYYQITPLADSLIFDANLRQHLTQICDSTSRKFATAPHANLRQQKRETSRKFATDSIVSEKVLKEGECVNTHTHSSSLETETTNAQTAAQKKIYDDKEGLYADLLAFWKSDETKSNAVKMELDRLGINDTTPEKKRLFFDYVRDVFCASIVVNSPFALSQLDIHKKVIQKMGFSETKTIIKNLGATKAQAQITTKSAVLAVAPKPENSNSFTNDEIDAILAFCAAKSDQTHKSIDDYKKSPEKEIRAIYKMATRNGIAQAWYADNKK
ncbi:MAG: hypothetical protein U5L45_00325 [Saprospiraceae bacterium]|nr:hypothetical protein [Saprospiraceae bacterium]